MIPWVTIESAPTPSGAQLSLHQRGDEFVIRIGGLDLMGSRAFGSERELATRGCAGLREATSPRVLVGGLGLGHTVRAALDALPASGRVDVAELFPAVVRWNRGPLAHLAERPLEDPRVRVVEADVADVLDPSAAYDAILLDVDNGPAALTAPGNARLYAPRGLARLRASLRPRGLLGIWSAADDPAFTARLAKAGFEVRVERVAPRGKGPKRHVLWLARAR